ncbi:MAG: transcription elongation factor GreA [Patescibacteria group bacterium]
MEIVYLTKERYEELQKELDELKTLGRRQVADRLKHAKELGDLSENSEYQEAREEQSRLEQKIAQLDELLRHSSIIKKSSGIDSVRIGSKVKVQKNKETAVYTIVGSNEADPSSGFISNASPIGRSLLGKKTGDIVVFITPKGEVSCRILAIE